MMQILNTTDLTQQKNVLQPEHTLTSSEVRDNKKKKKSEVGEVE